MLKDKICPMMAQGWVSGYNVSANQFFDKLTDEDQIWRLPKCLKENCALWIEKCLGKKGHCGLKPK